MPLWTRTSCSYHMSLSTKSHLTDRSPPHTNKSLARIHLYMDDAISVVQGRPDFSPCPQVAFLYLPGESKDLVSIKNLLAGEGGWSCAKEVLGWTLNMEGVTVILQDKKLRELLTLVDIPTTQHRIDWKDNYRLSGKI